MEAVTYFHPVRDAELLSRLRAPSKLPRILNRTQELPLNHALTGYHISSISPLLCIFFCLSVYFMHALSLLFVRMAIVLSIVLPNWFGYPFNKHATYLLSYLTARFARSHHTRPAAASFSRRLR